MLRGYSLPDGAEIWSREGLSCSVYSALGDTLHCFGLTPMDTKLYLVDMATGEDRTIELSVQPSSLEVVGSDASLLISRVSIETGGVLFSVPVADGARFLVDADPGLHDPLRTAQRRGRLPDQHR